MGEGERIKEATRGGEDESYYANNTEEKHGPFRQQAARFDFSLDGSFQRSRTRKSCVS